MKVIVIFLVFCVKTLLRSLSLKFSCCAARVQDNYFLGYHQRGKSRPIVQHGFFTIFFFRPNLISTTDEETYLVFSYIGKTFFYLIDVFIIAFFSYLHCIWIEFSISQLLFVLSSPIIVSLP